MSVTNKMIAQSQLRGLAFLKFWTGSGFLRRHQRTLKRRLTGSVYRLPKKSENFGWIQMEQ